MADQQTSKNPILQSKPQRRWFFIPRNSERGQALVETVFLFLALAFIFNMLQLREKEHQATINKYKFTGSK